MIAYKAVEVMLMSNITPKLEFEAKRKDSKREFLDLVELEEPLRFQRSPNKKWLRKTYFIKKDSPLIRVSNGEHNGPFASQQSKNPF